MNQDVAATQAQRPDALHRTLAWISALSVALIVVLTCADVLGRYLLSAPVRGSVEMIEFAMALVIFSALPLVTSQRGHVTVSLIDNLVKGRGRKVKQALCDAVSALALGLLTWRLYAEGQSNLESRSATVVLGLPHAPLSFALTLFAGLSTLLVLGMIWRSLNSKGDIE